MGHLRHIRTRTWVLFAAALFVLAAYVASIFLEVAWVRRDERLVVGISEGSFGVSYVDGPLPWPPRNRTGLIVRQSPYAVRWWFWFDRTVHYKFPTVYAASIPLWMPTVLLSLIAFWSWRRDHRIAIRLRHFACVRCGYSRQGLPSDAPCPECGDWPQPAA